MKQNFILILLFILCVVRLIIGAGYELSPDESQYFMWSERLDWGYYSKGPGVALFIFLSTKLFGWIDPELSVRFFSPILSLLSSLIIYALAKKFFTQKSAILAVILFNVCPIFNIGSIVLTIDPISIFFWLLAVYVFTIALENKKTHFWALTGLIIGFGFLAKFTNAFQLASIFLILVCKQEYRKYIFSKKLAILVVSFLISCFPPLYWNYKNDWITLTHLKERGNLDQSSGINFNEFFSYLGAHFGVYSPLIFLALLITFFYIFYKIITKKTTVGEYILFFFSLPIILTYFLLSFKNAGEANWTAPGFASLGIITASYIYKNWKKYTLFAITTSFIFSIAILNTDFLRVIGIKLNYLENKNSPKKILNIGDPSTRLRAWEKTAQIIETELNKIKPSEKVFLIAQRYQVAAELNFYLKKNHPKIFRPSIAHPPVQIQPADFIQNQFSIWKNFQNDTQYIGKDAIFIIDKQLSNVPPKKIYDSFSIVKALSIVEIKKFNKIVRTIKIFHCKKYKGYKS